MLTSQSKAQNHNNKNTVVSSNVKHIKHKYTNTIRNIRIYHNKINPELTFSEEIPEELKCKNCLGKLKFWNKECRNRWNWDKIPKDAKNLDKQLPYDRKHTIDIKYLNLSAVEAAEKLKDDSKAYINKYRDYDDTDSDTKLLIYKRLLIAKKLINKIHKEIEYSISHRRYYLNLIKEGARNVELLPSREIGKSAEKLSLLENLSNSFKDMSSIPLFEPGQDPKAEDCRQGSLGDCWLQATLICILKQKGPYPIKDMLKDQGDKVRVRLYYPTKKSVLKNGKIKLQWIPKYYIVKKQIPNIFDKSTSKNFLYNYGSPWVHYIQAAVAKSNIRNKYTMYKDNTQDKESPSINNRTKIIKGKKFRDYSSVETGSLKLGLKILLGKKASGYIKNYDDSNNIEDYLERIYEIQQARRFDLIRILLDTKKCIAVSFYKSNSILPSKHAYAVVGYEEDENGNVTYLRLINPHNSRSGIDKDGKTKNFEGEGDESFKISYSDFWRYFYELLFE